VEPKAAAHQKCLIFFVQLTNSIGVPVVLVGTFKAKAVLSGEFHQIRRGTGQGDLVWDRMEKGEWVDDHNEGVMTESQKPGVWQLLLESLWTYQYVKVPCPLTKELSDALYEETQGITDFACKVYMLAQVRAIVTARSPEDEIITTDIIRSVARDSLRQAQPVLSALRRGDDQHLSAVPDINPINADDFILEARKELPKEGKPGTATLTMTHQPCTLTMANRHDPIHTINLPIQNEGPKKQGRTISSRTISEPWGPKLHSQVPRHLKHSRTPVISPPQLSTSKIGRSTDDRILPPVLSRRTSH
jgi:hypothetical protein